MPDFRLYRAIAAIVQHKGALQIEKDLHTGLSPRQLRRLFEFYVGDSAKKFSQIVRFQNLLLASPSAAMLKQEKVFFDLGYYDQAHFIKEFKRFYGTSPRRALG